MNRLANESSPYLLQHADNPVDWFPWGEEALELATKHGFGKEIISAQAILDKIRAELGEN